MESLVETGRPGWTVLMASRANPALRATQGRKAFRVRSARKGTRGWTARMARTVSMGRLGVLARRAQRGPQAAAYRAFPARRGSMVKTGSMASQARLVLARLARRVPLAQAVHRDPQARPAWTGKMEQMVSLAHPGWRARTEHQAALPGSVSGSCSPSMQDY